MARYLLDTNICIYIAKGSSDRLLARFEALVDGEVAMSVVTYGELLFGAERSTRSAQAMATVAELSAAIPVLALGPGVGAHYGSIRAFLAAAGTPIGNNDLWIAAHARSERLTVVTNDESEFRRVPALTVENWVKDPRRVR